MKYMILIYSSQQTWDALTQEQRDRMVTDHAALRDELLASGEWAGGNVLTEESTTRSVRPARSGNGGTVVTDGPFIEAKEHIAGYDLVECESLERALEIAARVPDAAICGVEVRAIVDVGVDDGET